jgi:hypothetical protein
LQQSTHRTSKDRRTDWEQTLGGTYARTKAPQQRKTGTAAAMENEIRSGGHDALMKTTVSWNYSFGIENPTRNRTSPRTGTHARTRTEDRAVGSEPEVEREVQARAHVLLADASAHQTKQKNRLRPRPSWSEPTRRSRQATKISTGIG